MSGRCRAGTRSGGSAGGCGLTAAQHALWSSTWLRGACKERRLCQYQHGYPPNLQGSMRQDGRSACQEHDYRVSGGLLRERGLRAGTWAVLPGYQLWDRRVWA